LLRVAHPFPSSVNAAITTGLALLAGGALDVSFRLGLSMLAIQAAIGAANDLADVARDTIAKPSKPIPAGDVAAPEARMVAGVGLVVGLALAASVSVLALTLAVGGAIAGFGYDLRLKGTAVSWLPFAMGIPLLPLFAVGGATGRFSTTLITGAVIAVPAGIGLSIANALPDEARDAATGVRTLAVMLGRARAWLVGAACMIGVAAGASVSYVVLCGLTAGVLPQLALVGSIFLLGGGVVLARGASVGHRQLGWELQAIALGCLAAAWAGGLAIAGRL
jgi:4-hydroxybenzoate polyprenyltransferase